MKNLMDILNNKDFLEKMASVRNADELKTLFEEEGLELEEGLSYEQAYTAFQRAIHDELSADEKAQINAMDDELNEAELENVSGGYLGFAIAIGVMIYVGYRYIKLKKEMELKAKNR